MVVVTDEVYNDLSYSVFHYNLDDNLQEIISLTGVRSAKFPTKRVYIGLSHDAAEMVVRTVYGNRKEDFNLKSLDKMVVNPHFIAKTNDSSE